MSGLKQALRPVALRLRLIRAVRALAMALLFVAATALLLMALSFFLPIKARAQGLLALCALPPLAFFTGLCRPIARKTVACAADCAGALRERAQTALLLVDDPSPMTARLQSDAQMALKQMDVRRAMPIQISRAMTIWTLSIALVLGGLVFVPNPMDQVIAADREMREEFDKRADAIEKAASDIAPMEEAARVEALKKIAKETASALRASDTREKALLSVARGEQALRKLMQEKPPQALEMPGGQNSAPSQETSAKNDPNGQKNQSQSAAQNGQNAQSGQNANGQNASGQNAAQNAKNTQNAQNKQSPSNNAPTQGACPNPSQSKGNANAQSAAQNALSSGLQQALSSAKAGISGNASGAGAQTGRSPGAGQGQGQGQGVGQGKGSGGGKGTSSADAGYQEDQSPRKASGQGTPGGFTRAYESIYDPTRLGDGGEIVNATGKVREGETGEMELAPGQGVAGESVPYNEVIETYKASASRAAENPDMPGTVRAWVNQYFASLTE